MYIFIELTNLVCAFAKNSQRFLSECDVIAVWMQINVEVLWKCPLVLDALKLVLAFAEKKLGICIFLEERPPKFSSHTALRNLNATLIPLADFCLKSAMISYLKLSVSSAISDVFKFSRIYESAPWSIEAWSRPIECSPLASTRLAGTGMNSTVNSNTVSIILQHRNYLSVPRLSMIAREKYTIHNTFDLIQNQTTVFCVRCGTSRGIISYWFRSETHRDMAAWARALVQGSHNAINMQREFSFRCVYQVMRDSLESGENEFANLNNRFCIHRVARVN